MICFITLFTEKKYRPKESFAVAGSQTPKQSNYFTSIIKMNTTSLYHSCESPSLYKSSFKCETRRGSLSSCCQRRSTLPARLFGSVKDTSLICGERSRRRGVIMGSSVSSVGKNTEDGSLQKGIAELYDESSGIWEDIWGDHMHHGYYDKNVEASISDHRSAQIRLIEETLRFAGVSDDPLKKPKSIVDVGCGIGGSSRYLAKKYGAKSQGITLSPIQAERANALAVAEGLGDKVSFQVADALAQPFPDGQFDLVWSMESGEHMPDKAKFVNELVRVAAPGATIIIVTWCHRDLSPSENSLQPQEKALLDKICDAYYLPAWCSTADYVKLLESQSLQDIKTADWSEYVAPFWPAVIRSALTWKGLTSLLRAGWKTIKGALAMPLMVEGFQKDLIKFAVITCRKPE